MLPDHSKVLFSKLPAVCELLPPIITILLQNSFKIDPECLYPVNKAMFTSRFGKKSR